MRHRAVAIRAFNFNGVFTCKALGITQNFVLQDGFLNRDNSFQKVFKITVLDHTDNIGG